VYVALRSANSHERFLELSKYGVGGIIPKGQEGRRVGQLCCTNEEGGQVSSWCCGSRDSKAYDGNPPMSRMVDHG
jgi:hypothetical protein